MCGRWGVMGGDGGIGDTLSDVTVIFLEHIFWKCSGTTLVCQIKRMLNLRLCNAVFCGLQWKCGVTVCVDGI